MRMRLHSERGITSVVVAVSLVGLIAALMLSVDAGNTWQTRRQIITSTDASALDQGRLASLKGPASACQSGWTALLTRNAGSDVQDTMCTLINGALPGTGYVTVEARKPIAVRFGGIFGIGDSSAYSMSAARWQVASDVIGVRPIGFCLQNHHMQEWMTHVNPPYTPLPAPGTGGALEHPIYPGAGLVHHMTWTKQFNDGSCGSGSGNWGFLDYDGGSNSTVDLAAWLTGGYQGNSVAIGDCNGDTSTLSNCSGDTGLNPSNQVTVAMNSLIGKTIGIVVYDTLSGSGSTAEFHIYNFIGVILRGWCVNGKGTCTNPDTDDYMDFEFTTINLTPGNQCCVPATNLGASVLRICSTDHDPQAIAARCVA